MRNKKRYLVLFFFLALCCWVIKLFFFQDEREDIVREYEITDFTKPFTVMYRCEYWGSYLTIELEGEIDQECDVLFARTRTFAENWPRCEADTNNYSYRFEKEVKYKETEECVYEGNYRIISFYPRSSTKGKIKLKIREFGYCSF